MWDSLLNLTIATLDGIFKHTKLNEKERKHYKDIFDSYREAFWEDKFNRSVCKKLTECLFEYVSPVTCEGIIVSIADEIAQLCHDIEDIRRLGRFEAVREFYEVVKKEIGNPEIDLSENVKECELFETSLNDVNDDNDDKNKADCNADCKIIKLERYYIKLMINLCIPIVSKVIKKLRKMNIESQMELFKKHYLGEFGVLKKEGRSLGLNSNDIKLIESLDIIEKKYKDTLKTLPEVARWDIKGNELCMDLANTLYKALNHKNNNANGITLNIFNPESRKDLERSYEAGILFSNKIRSFTDDIPIKFVVLDYLVGMTDSFMIKEYESLTFKMAELR